VDILNSALLEIEDEKNSTTGYLEEITDGNCDDLEMAMNCY